MTELLEIGVVGRPHGTRGEVSIRLSTNVADRLAVGTALVADQRVLTVASVRRHGDRWLVGFEGVTDRAAAEQLRGLVLRAEPLPEDPGGGYWVHEIVGAAVRDAGGTPRGTVESVEANPASDLLVLDSGVLVPVGFVTAVESGVVVVDAPAGLFEL